MKDTSTRSGDTRTEESLAVPLLDAHERQPPEPPFGARAGYGKAPYPGYGAEAPRGV